ncbi:MAG: type II secretion system F family protein [Oscillospiraceae bacterium]|nr:type II secretion system F family protein [Oscillospiraceae bacterium]
MTALLILTCVSCGVFVYAVLAAVLDTSKRDRVRERLAALESQEDLDSLYLAVLAENKAKKRRGSKQLIRISKQLEDLLAMSGVRLNANEYIYGWIGFTLLPALVLLLFRANVLTVAAGAIVGFAIPPILVRRSRNKRRQLFNQQLGESLVIMSNCLSSGFSFQQAMESIANEMQPPISTEFARVLREMKFGTSIEEALDHMAKRVWSDELELLISAVLTSAQVGANLVDILGICTETVNDRIKIKNEIRVLSAQGRMSGIILSALPIVVILMLMFINPGYISSFFETPTGRALIIAGFALEGVGFLVIQKLVDIRY